MSGVKVFLALGCGVLVAVCIMSIQKKKASKSEAKAVVKPSVVVANMPTGEKIEIKNVEEASVA